MFEHYVTKLPRGLQECFQKRQLRSPRQSTAHNEGPWLTTCARFWGVFPDLGFGLRHGWWGMRQLVPQGFILRPTLWNGMYNGVLTLKLPKGVEIVGFADQRCPFNSNWWDFGRGGNVRDHGDRHDWKQDASIWREVLASVDSSLLRYHEGLA